ncbi:MAG: pitrilysin family protein [Patescibacteria group bacterium]
MAKRLQVNRLKNGLPFLKIPVAGTPSASLLALARVGSRLETANQQGLSHFLEHMLFKGTRRWPTAKELTQVLDGVGAEYNAYTTKEYTGYYIKVAAEYLPLAAQVMQEMLWHSRLDSAEMDKEKKVIIEEINMYEDNPLMCIGDVLEGELYKGSTLGNLISGTRQTVSALTHRQLRTFWEKYYHPRNMVVAVAGKIKAGAETAIRQLFGESRPAGHRGKFVKFIPRITSPRAALKFKDTEQVQLAIAFPSFGRGHKALPVLRLLSVILGGNMSSRLFVRLREKEGLCYSVRSGLDQYDGTGLLAVQAGLDKTRLHLAIKLIREELAKIMNDGVTQDELNRAKEYTKGSLTLSLEDSLAQAEWASKHFFLESSLESSRDYLHRMSAVTLADIKLVARRVFGQNQATLALVGPFKKAKPFLQLLS